MLTSRHIPGHPLVTYVTPPPLTTTHHLPSQYSMLSPLTSQYTTQPPLTPQHAISPHITIHHNAPPPLTPQHAISSHITIHHNAPPPLTPQHPTSPHTTAPQALTLACSAIHRLLAARLEPDAQVSVAKSAHSHPSGSSAGPNTRTRAAGAPSLSSAHVLTMCPLLKPLLDMRPYVPSTTFHQCFQQYLFER